MILRKEIDKNLVVGNHVVLVEDVGPDNGSDYLSAGTITQRFGSLIRLHPFRVYETCSGIDVSHCTQKYLVPLKFIKECVVFDSIDKCFSHAEMIAALHKLSGEE